jgi:hypothetical protein
VAQVEALDTLEVSMVRAYRPIDLERPRGLLSNIHRGVHGLLLRREGEFLISAPTEMIARNTSFLRLLKQFDRQRSVAGGQERLEAFAMDGEQFLIALRPGQHVIPLTRGTRLVAPEQVTEDGVEAVAQGLIEWLARNVGPSGRMVYRYWPSRGEESSADNMIRQWMATRCLIKVARARSRRRGLAALATRNLEYNLAQSFRDENGLGVIDCDGKVKLGAVALAALAIVEHPDRGRYSTAESALVRMTEYLWREDGSFTTFFRPEGRSDNQNFYPGEALLLWATLFAESRDPVLLNRIMVSFRHYRDRHRADRNPAFVPWHTQAYYLVWQVTEDPDLRDFVLEMNDWLLSVQQWESATYPEMRGQFYVPRHPEYGPPHASSTGVYLEGLIDAFSLALAIGDTRRAETYRLVIARGLRSIMQLQFSDDVDMFYIAKKDRVRGAVRTTTYDNTIRVDNVQHNLDAILKIQRRFDSSDYSTEPLPSALAARRAPHRVPEPPSLDGVRARA